MGKQTADYFLEQGDFPNTGKYPVCSKCHHATKSPDGYFLCYKFLGIVTGNPQLCVYLRYAPDLCGRQGKFFEGEE